jgi:hypothetical protein
MSTTTESITQTARAFFDACETGKGWAACSAYCQPNASFAAQAEPLADMQTLQQYTDWMKAMLVVLPDASYAVKSFAADHERNNVCAFAVFSAPTPARAARCPPPARAPAPTTST